MLCVLNILFNFYSYEEVVIFFIFIYEGKMKFREVKKLIKGYIVGKWKCLILRLN